MNSKIVILNDSVILYQHYISDVAWESVLGFPRGGLTYLIKNNNIKFYAYIDYFYRNCLMTMDLPIYIVDEELGIDGEYDDIDEISQILNRIFPANGDQDLALYLKKSEAEETYQPIGTYFDDVEYDSSGKTIDFYSDGALVDSIDATDFIKDGMVDQVELIELSGDTYLHIVFNTDAGKEPIDIPLGDLFDADNYYTKDEVDALIPEVPSLDGYATETWVQNQGYINQIKTINNISLIGEGNIQIGSGGTIDAYTKEEADDRFQPKGDYVTTTTFNTYILNLTQQITSLQEAIEACCSGQTGETLYRWVTLTGPNDYICSGTTKYAKEQKQQSTDNGATWQNVSPAEYRTGSAIETQSTDCGYEPTIEYRWVNVSGGYVCSGTTKYNQEKKQYRVDGGSWIDTDPLETRRGSTVIETQSTDCGYTPVQYRWYQASASDYMCYGTSKYYKEYYQVSYDGGSTWENVTPVQTRRGSLIENQSYDCGYSGGYLTYGEFIGNNKLYSYCGTKVWPSLFENIISSNMVSDEGALSKNRMEKTVIGACCRQIGAKVDDNYSDIVLYGPAPNLISITCDAIVPPVIYKGNNSTYNTFDNTNDCPIYVPSGSVDAYKSADGWSKYANRIQAIP